MKNLSPRKKDILSFIFVIVLSGAISYVLYLNQFGTLLPGFIATWLGCFGLIFVCIFSYLESRDKDPFVTGKTQSMGVMNSFILAAILIGFLFEWFNGWAIATLITCICMFASRELGRYSCKKYEETYLNQSGILLSDLPNKAKAEINGKKVTVWSKDTIKAGTPIYISEIKAKYLYVSPVEDKENF